MSALRVCCLGQNYAAMTLFLTAAQARGAKLVTCAYTDLGCRGGLYPLYVLEVVDEATHAELKRHAMSFKGEHHSCALKIVEDE